MYCREVRGKVGVPQRGGGPDQRVHGAPRVIIINIIIVIIIIIIIRAQGSGFRGVEVIRGLRQFLGPGAQSTTRKVSLFPLCLLTVVVFDSLGRSDPPNPRVNGQHVDIINKLKHCGGWR